MAQFIRMPAVMANATDAVLSEWLTNPGDSIAIGDPIAEIETDKAVVEYAAEIGGTIGRLLVSPGMRVMVGEPIIVVLDPGENAAAIPEVGGPSPAVETIEEAAPPPTTGVAPSPAVAPSQAENPSDTSAAVHATASTVTGQRQGPRLFATPIARRVAAQRGIDLTLLTGTGPNGRIVRRDVDAYRATTTAAATSPVTPPPSGGYRDAPLTAMRRAIAQRLTESKSTIPHFYVTAHIRADKLLALRQDVNASSQQKVSLNDFIVKAVGMALIDVPAANASWNGDSIRYFDSADVAVAVSVPNGLLTPVVRGVERLGLVELSAQLTGLVEAARSGHLQQRQLEGGSFTVSNLGMYGVAEFAAIINPPQAGILAVAAAKPMPVTGDDGQLSVGNVMTVTLSADHRVVDGAVAADWMTVLVNRLQNPVSLLL